MTQMQIIGVSIVTTKEIGVIGKLNPFSMAATIKGSKILLRWSIKMMWGRVALEITHHTFQKATLCRLLLTRSINRYKINILEIRLCRERGMVKLF